MSTHRKPIPPYDKPTLARAVDGEVALSGPGNIGVSLTPEAAHATARQIADATEKARRQREDREARMKMVEEEQRLGVRR